MTLKNVDRKLKEKVAQMAGDQQRMQDLERQNAELSRQKVVLHKRVQELTSYMGKLKSPTTATLNKTSCSSSVSQDWEPSVAACKEAQNVLENAIFLV